MNIKRLAIQCGFYETNAGDIGYAGYDVTKELQAFANAIEAMTIDRCADEKYDWVMVQDALNYTPTQSLAEHDKKVIEDYEEANAHPPHRSCMCQICNEYFKDDHIVSNYTIPPIDNEEK